MTRAPDAGLPLAGDPLDDARWQTLVALGRTDATLLSDLRETFSQNAPELVRRVLAGVAAGGDLADARAAAHRLRGMAGNLGARRVALLATAIEEAAIAADRERCTQLSRLLDDEIVLATRALAARVTTAS